MAAFYELRYWKNFEQPDGSIIRLEIHSKGIEGVSFTAYEIGPVVQALALTIQGQTEDVDAPIVKTSLTMTFVDAPDHADSVLKKCGDWEEFYTNDSTYWKVLIKAKKNPSSASYAQLWGGYVTPDSFSEELRYRGSVTIVARDNIGHMQDFPFDAEGDENGMISLKELVETAWAKIESPMALYWPSARWLECEGVYAFDTLMNVSAFKGKNWYEAVESALYAYGAVMRYNGENQVLLCSLRYMPQQARPSMDQVTHIEPVFIASAHRELTPAARRIEESVSFETGDGWQLPLAKGITFTGSEDDVTFLSKNVFGETTRTSIPVNPIDRIGGEGWQNDTSASLFFNPKMYTIRDAALKDDAERMIFLACNTDGSHRATFRKTVYCKDMEIRFRFGRVVQRDDLGGVQYSFGFASGTEDNGIGSIRIKKVQCYVTAEQNGITQYWTGSEWQTAAYRLELAPNEGEFGIGISFMDITGQAALSFIFESIIVDAMYDYSKGYGLYVPISTMSFGVLQGLSLCAKNNVNTNYNEKNNVIISRTPELAPAMDEVPFPAAIKNGIFYKSDGVYLPAKAWNWDGGTPQQMAVYNHLQLLCYHSKPNNLITGDIVNADVIKTAAIYVWGGKEHLLISGTYNYLNGRIEGAALREFVRYDDMWGDVTGSSLPDVQADSTTNAEEGGPSSSGVTYENTTNVVIGGEGGGSVTIDPFLSDTSSNPVESKAIKAYIDSADNEIKERIAALEEGGDVDHPVFEFIYDTTTNKATAEMVAALAEAIAADKLILCNGRTYKFILEQDGMYGLVSDAYKDIMDGKLKASVLAVVASTYDVQLMEEEVPVGTEITEETVRGWGFTKNAGTITGIMMNGATIGISGVVDLGKVITEHQQLKTINGQSIVGEGNITIQGGGAAPRVEMTETSAVLQPNTFHVWPMMDALDLTLGAEQTGVMNRYLFQFRNPKAGLTILTLPDDITWSEDTELDENGMPVMEVAAFYRIEIIEGLASLKKWKLVYINFADAEVERVLMSKGVSSDGVGITKEDAKKVTSISTWFKDNKVIQSFNELVLFTGVKTISAQAFRRCANLKSIDLANVQKIEYAAFAQSGLEEDIVCPSLQSITSSGDRDGTFHSTKIKKVLDLGSITSLFNGYNASSGGVFAYASELTYANLPPTLTLIGRYTFYGCGALETIICRATTPPTLGNDAFANTNSTFLIYVPDASLEAYKTAMNWNTYASRILPISESAMIIHPRDNYTLTSEVQLSLQYYGEDVMPVWSVDSGVAEIDDSGLLTFSDYGDAIITATYNNEAKSKTLAYKRGVIITQDDFTDELLVRTTVGGGRNEFTFSVQEYSSYRISVEVKSGAPIKSCIHIKRSQDWADNEYDGGWINPGVTQSATEAKDADRSCPYAGVGFTYTSGAGYPTAEEVQQYCVIKIELVE